VRKLAATVRETFDTTGEVGVKYLVNHSAGSGKTLTICWLADRLHSLYQTGTSNKLLDMVFILTDRRSLDKNIRDEMENFAHLQDVVGILRTTIYLMPIKSEVLNLLNWFVGALSTIFNVSKRVFRASAQADDVSCTDLKSSPPRGGFDHNGACGKLHGLGKAHQKKGRRKTPHASWRERILTHLCTGRYG